jgi:hypothetical protein
LLGKLLALGREESLCCGLGIATGFSRELLLLRG